MLRALGNPQLACPPTIHIAGTNGKGSTLAFLRAMLEADGARVHSYSSPHLIRFHERINLGGRDIDEARLIACLEHCRRVNGAAPITFFEITTAAAFLAFSQTPADYLLLETGLGGRLDATNLAAPIASVITPISLDHQDFLGETLAEIAAEKAGILKPDTPAIIAPQAEAARDIICARADALGIALSLGGRDWQVRSDYGRLAFETLAGLRDLPLPNLAGAHQLVNAGTAIATALQLGIGDASIERGLTQARWAGRLTRLDAQLWLDGGHNEAAAIALAQWCAAHDTPTQIILGLMAHKNADAFLGAFAKCDKIARVLTIAIPDQDKSFSAKTLAQKARGLGLDATPFADLESALNSATETSGRILICGSLYLAGAVLRARAN